MDITCPQGLRQQRDLLDAPPPADDEAERTLIGSVFARWEWCESAVDSLTADTFRVHPHRLLWQAIQDLRRDGEPIDIGSVGERLHRAGRLREVGAALLIDLLWEGEPAYAEHYARRVSRASAQREAAEIGCGVIQAAYGDADPVEIRRAGQRLEELADEIEQGKAPRRRLKVKRIPAGGTRG